MAERQEISSILPETADIKKLFKSKDYGKYVYNLGEDSPADITDYISTGSTLLDLILSNKKNGGIPVGRITMLAGDSSSGKSLLIGHLIKSTQDKGGIAVLIEPEVSSSVEFLSAIGVDINNLIYMVIPTVEKTFDTIDDIIEKLRTKYPNKLVFVAVDSLTSLATEEEKEREYTLEGFGMEKAKFLSLAFKKITDQIGKMKIALLFTNQIRQKIGATMFEDPDIIPGGKSIIFYASVLLKLKKAAKIKVKRGNKDEVIGVYSKAKTEKNRCAPPLRECEFPVYFDRGIDDNASLFNEFLARKYIVIPKDASTVYFDLFYSKENSPESIKQNWSDENIEKLYNDLCNISFMKKNFKELPKKDELKDFNPEKTLAFAKENWREVFEIKEFKEFYVDILTEAMQLKYLHHNVDENKDILIDKSED